MKDHACIYNVLFLMFLFLKIFGLVCKNGRILNCSLCSMSRMLDTVELEGISFLSLSMVCALPGCFNHTFFVVHATWLSKFADFFLQMVETTQQHLFVPQKKNKQHMVVSHW